MPRLFLRNPIGYLMYSRATLIVMARLILPDVQATHSKSLTDVEMVPSACHDISFSLVEA
jgi:hypothetical protein